MDNAQQQLVEKLRTSNNVLVTVSRNPNVDQLAALLGLSLLLNKQGKHCAAVFSGKIPSTLEFLKPEDTIEKNTDSLRDFIIALDKSKADKLRYKVEDNVVRIFITPYKTSITEKDLDFSQGDFNVDLVVAIGVKEQADLDDAITNHGRILHDAVVASINVTNEGQLGSINWHDVGASSLSELVTDLAQQVGDDLLDEQISTALLTGIVAETNRFSNDKTSSQTMAVSSVLMAAGANQQLVASKLDGTSKPTKTEAVSSSDAAKDDQSSSNNDGTLEIDHEAANDGGDKPKDENKNQENKPEDNLPQPSENNLELPPPSSGGDDWLSNQGSQSPLLTPAPLPSPAPLPELPPSGLGLSGPKLMTEPPSLGGTLTANSTQSDIDPVTDPMSMPQTDQPMLLERKPMGGAPPAPLLPIDNLSTDMSLVPPSAPGPIDQTYTAPPPPAPSTSIAPTDTALPAQSEPVVSQINMLQPDSAVSPSPVVDIQPPIPLTPTPPADPIVPPIPADTTEPNTEEETPAEPEPSPQVQIDEDGTLSQLEQAVNSPHLENADQDAGAHADAAREEISRALSSSDAATSPEPITALNAQPMDSGLDLGLGDNPVATTDTPDPSVPVVIDPTAAPPVPPPIPFEFGKPST